ncbi:outer membrane beta-barrel protein [Pseudoduganella violaceinigra]|uniref:outer membrane beta-barrel protein n=1 Tax=Pseudoduganella violaceinigra TaxID=246602 RepID=UPI0004269AF3|nr:outer membrane beta-barrel protein [Pseudoduganella violaceinigra]
MKKFVFAVGALFATMGAAYAQSQVTQPSAVSFLAGMGISGGGDNLATARFTNGTSQKIKAGGGFYFTTGVNYQMTQEFSLQGTVNFHVDDTSANNGSIKFQRFPLEVLGYYHINDQLRIGAGLRYVSGAKLSSSGAAEGYNTKFDDTLSSVAEAEYFWVPNFGMKLRYVKETFKAPGIRDVKANHVGISGNIYF